MYHWVCFILFLSLNVIKIESSNLTHLATSPSHNNETATPKPTKMPTQVQSTTVKPLDCLIRLSNMKESLLFWIIALLLLICLMLLVIIMCLTCKSCCGLRNDKMVMMKSFETTRRTSVNGGPSETDLMLKDCSSVKVEIEPTPDEVQTPEEAREAAAEIGNQVFIGQKENSANNTSELAPTQEVDYSGQTDPKTVKLLETAK